MARFSADGTHVIPENFENIANGRVVKNEYVNINVEDTTLTATAGTATPTCTADNATGIISCQLPEGTGRSYATTNTVSWTAGHIYCLSVEFTNVLNASSGTNTILNVSAVTVDFGVIVLARTTISAPGRYAIIFQPTTTQTSAFRIGIGTSGNATAAAGGARLDFKNIMIEDLSLSNAGVPMPSPYVQPKMSALISADYLASLATQTAGLLTVQNDYRFSAKGLSIAIFGDSFTNEATDYTGQLQGLINPKIAVWYQIEISPGVTVSGTRPSAFLVPFQTKMQYLIDNKIAPTYCLLQSSVNTISASTGVTAQDADIATDIAAIRTAAIWAIDNGIQPIFTNMTAWKGACATWISDAKYHAQQRWDTKIYALGAELGCPVFNLRAALEDPAIPYQLAAAYDSGDNLHPSSTKGSAAIAAALHKFITGSSYQLGYFTAAQLKEALTGAQTVTGSRATVDVMVSLLAALVNLGLIVDSTTA